MLSTKIYTTRDLDVGIITDTFIPNITLENAYLYNDRDRDDYIKVFNLQSIYEGLIKHDKQYYYYNHNILQTDKGIINRGSITKNYSYDVYPIQNELAERILDTKEICIWEIKLHAYFYYGRYYHTKFNVYRTINTEYKCIQNDDSLLISYGKFLTNVDQGITIKEVLDHHHAQYKNIKLNTINTALIRQMKLEDICL